MLCTFKLVLSPVCVQRPYGCYMLFLDFVFRYFLTDTDMALFAPVIHGIAFVFTFHIRCISIVRSLYFRISSAAVLTTFMPPETATSISVHVPSL